MLTRRDFGLRSLRTALLLPFIPRFSQAGGPPPGSQNGFPAGDYTPYGYLDNPYHSWALNRSGVLRSCRGIGFGWHYPAGPGGYFDEKKNGIYSTFLRLGFQIDDRRLWEMEDFHAGELRCVHHSTRLMQHELRVAGTQCTCTFVQASEHTLAVRIERTDSSAIPIVVLAAHRYELNSEWWGGDGVVGEWRAKDNCLVTRSFAAGVVFAIASTANPQKQMFYSGEDLFSALAAGKGASQAIRYAHDPLQGALAFSLTRGHALDICMARGANRTAAVKGMRRALGRVSDEIDAKKKLDSAFWNSAPQLEGDWPQHWKNGWVYDFETLRMIVRTPIGVYRHSWDGMQIQAPRNVLAETSIDMWALSHADPETAKEVFAGQFLDALEANVPCMREDGVMNMVAADGSECGTSISWCYPFFCANSIYSRTRDLKWLGRVYPGMARLLRWTIANRSDKDEFIVGKCSWETGMDGDRRFLIDQPTGAELIDFIRIVELQAAAAHAAGVLVRFAQELGDAKSLPEWNGLRDKYAARTQQLWNGADWFHDFDTRGNRPITNVGKDIGQCAPIFSGAAHPDQVRAMMPALREFYQHSRSGTGKNVDGWTDGLQWSSLTLPYLESLWTAGEYELLAQVVNMIADRIYPSMDRRKVSTAERSSSWTIPREGDSRIGIPGVSCEMWMPAGAGGGEGYGWGAVLPAHIMRNIVGARESEKQDAFWLCPNLPAELMVPFKRYVLRNWQYGDLKLMIRYSVESEPGEILADIIGLPAGNRNAVFDQNGKPMQNINAAPRAFSFTAKNCQRYQVKLGLPRDRQNRPQ